MDEAGIEPHLGDIRLFVRQRSAENRRLEMPSEVGLQLREAIVDAFPKVVEDNQVGDDGEVAIDSLPPTRKASRARLSRWPNASGAASFTAASIAA